MKTRKSGLLQRMTAVLLAAVLVVGMTSNAVPMTVLAQEDTASPVSDGRQESTEGNTDEPAEGNTKPEEKAPAPAETTNPEEPKQEAPKPDETPKQETPVPEEEPKQETPKPDGETAEQGTVSGNDAQPEMTAAPQSVMLAAEPAPQADIIGGSESDGWILYADGRLAISSNTGMEGWIANGRNNHSSKVTSVDIHDGVTRIQGAAFNGCSGLKSITMVESVTSIGAWAFNDCSGLTGITIPSKVGEIGNAAFGNCSSLTEVKMEGETPPSAGTDVFYGCKFVTDNTQGIHVPAGKAETYKTAWTDLADYIVEDSESTDKGWTFENGKLTIKSDAGIADWITNGRSAHKSDVTSAEIQNGVTSILAGAFDECSSLEKITIPASVTSIGNHAFSWCTGLEEIAIPEKVTSIGGHAFQSCKGLENITISANVMSIGESAFSECLRLATVTMLGEPPRLGSNVFGAKGEATRVCGFITKNEKGIHVPAGKAQAYKDAWTEWADYIAEDSASAEEHKHNGVTFTPWTGTTSLPDTAGNYYLTKDVTLSSAWEVPNGVTNLCLNGKTISGSKTEAILISFSNALHLYDCQDTGKITSETQHGLSNYGIFQMHGGKISESKGGGVSNGGTFQMYGGEISGNDGTPGVSMLIDGTFTVGGDAVVSGNTVSGKEMNVLLVSGKTITIDGSNPLSESAKIGVTTYSAPTEGSPVDITGHNKGDYSSYFTSDNPAYEIVNANDVVQLAVKSETPSGGGSVTPEVRPGENAPKTGISTPAEELREMLLTDDEKRQVQNGTDVKIILEVKDAGSTVSDPDKAAVTQALNGFAVGQYLYIDLYKLVGADPDHKVITETAKKIKIVITVPDSLKNTDSSKTRTFAVIRVHNGSAELLNDLDNSADTLTIETDRFSTYAIVYKDTANGGGNSGGGGDYGSGDNGNGGGNSGGGDNNGSGNGAGGNGGADSGDGTDNNGSGNNDSGGSSNGAGNNNNGGGTGSSVGSAKNGSQNNSEKIITRQGSTRDDEPKTGDDTPVELCATLGMIAGFAYLLLYFADRERGMTEETKKELVSRLAGWAKQGGRIRRYLALAAIFVLLVYYHSIGKRTCVRWKAIYGE